MASHSARLHNGLRGGHMAPQARASSENGVVQSVSAATHARRDGAGTLVGGARIRHIFHAIFGAALEGIDPCVGMTDDQVRLAGSTVSASWPTNSHEWVFITMSTRLPAHAPCRAGKKCSSRDRGSRSHASCCSMMCPIRPARPGHAHAFATCAALGRPCCSKISGATTCSSGIPRTL